MGISGREIFIWKEVEVKKSGKKSGEEGGLL